jgi:GDP-L-fucose synthase
MEKNSKIYLAGHNGLVGSAIMRKLEKNGYSNIIFRKLEELDLRDFRAVEAFFSEEKPEYVFLAAAKVGGILANNDFGGDFIYDNLMIEANIIKCAQLHDVKKLLFLGSSCIYPKFAPQPINEECFLDGKLEETNKPYAVAKIAGIIMCQAFNKQFNTNFISVMPTNLYGPNDNFNLQSSHVMPALIRKFHEAKINKEQTVSVWGSGNPSREFLHVDDLADAVLYLMNNYDDGEIINIGTGKDITIKELAEMIKDLVGFTGDIIFDASKPDGTPKKQLDVTKLTAVGWKAKIDLREGITGVYEWFKNNN